MAERWHGSPSVDGVLAAWSSVGDRVVVATLIDGVDCNRRGRPTARRYGIRTARSPGVA
jgi:hypothetical protein